MIGYMASTHNGISVMTSIIIFAIVLVADKDTSRSFPRNFIPPSKINLVVPLDWAIPLEKDV